MKVLRKRSKATALSLTLGVTAAAMLVQQPNDPGPRGASAEAPRLGGALTRAGAALRAVFDREAPDPIWTAAARDRLAPQLFARGFDLECRTSVCALETTFETREAFREFVETTFEGRDPIWRGSFVLANADLPAALVGGGRGLTWRAVIFLADDRHQTRAAARTRGTGSVQVTPATDGLPGRPGDARSWGVRSVAGIPEQTMQNLTATQFRELIVPLAAPDARRGDGPADLRAFVAVGGPDMAERTPQCALQQRVAAGPAGPILVGSSGPRRYDPSYDAHAGTIELALASARGTAETVVRCSVPPQGWVGKIVWHLASADAASGAGAAEPYAANVE
jgi:hypothetical protein